VHWRRFNLKVGPTLLVLVSSRRSFMLTSVPRPIKLLSIAAQ